MQVLYVVGNTNSTALHRQHMAVIGKKRKSVQLPVIPVHGSLLCVYEVFSMYDELVAASRFTQVVQSWTYCIIVVVTCWHAQCHCMLLVYFPSFKLQLQEHVLGMPFSLKPHQMCTSTSVSVHPIFTVCCLLNTRCTFRVRPISLVTCQAHVVHTKNVCSDFLIRNVILLF